MNHEQIVPIILLLFCITGIVIAIYLLFFRKILMGKTLGVMFLSSAVATFAYIIQITCGSVIDHFTWIIIRYAALMLFAFMLALFVFEYTGVPITFRSWKFLGLVSVPVLALILLIADPNAPWLYGQIGVLSLEEIVAADQLIVPVYVVMQLYVVGLLITLIILLFRGISQKAKLNRINSLCIIGGIALYLVTHLLQLAGVRLLRIYSLNMFTYVPSAMLALWGVRRYRLADIRPIAYNTLFKQMQDGLLVIDHRGYLVDYNPVADRILTISSCQMIGEQFDSQKFAWAGFTDLADMAGRKMLRTIVNGIPYQILTNILTDNRGELYGYLVTVRDISSQVEIKRLHEAEIAREGAWKERVALARALHDSTLQNIGSLILLCGSVKESVDRSGNNNQSHLFDTLETAARLAYDDLRSLIKELQINDNPELVFNLWNELTAKVEFWNQQSETKILLETPEGLPMDTRQQRELFYLIVEATSNALKHADAGTIFIRFQKDWESVAAEIRDDGCGFDINKLQNTGMGLENMRSRALLLNGHLSITSHPAKGTTIRVVFPCSTHAQI